MWNKTIMCFFVVALAGCGARGPALPTSNGLAVSRVVLFQNGLGYVERTGALSQSHVDIRSRSDQLDDVLKSLTVIDRGGGKVSSVRVLPSGPDSKIVTLRVGLTPAAEHDLSVSYVAELSGWRPTYRIIAGKNGKGVRLQGLAVVDNLTEEQWNDIELVLSPDVPLSFRYELHAPRAANRPTLSSNGRLLQKAQPAGVASDGPREGNIQAAYAKHNTTQPQVSSRAGTIQNGNGPAAINGAPDTPSGGQTKEVNPLEALTGTEGASGVLVEGIGRFTLGPGESGLVPFVDTECEGELVYLYKPATGSGTSRFHPYRAAFFRNPLEAPLLTGPVAVYSQGGFLGDGVTGTIPTAAHAFVAYALEPSIRIESATERVEDDVRALSVTGGTVRLALQAVSRTRFVLSSTRPLDQPLYLFVERIEGFEPRDLPEGSVTTSAGFFVPASSATGGAVALEQIRERETRINIAVDPAHQHVPALLAFLEEHGDFDVDSLRQILDRVEELRIAEVRHNEDLVAERHALEERRQALDALRHVPANNALRQRVGRSVALGIRRIDELTREVVEANAEQVALRQQWYDLLRDLTVEPRA